MKFQSSPDGSADFCMAAKEGLNPVHMENILDNANYFSKLFKKQYGITPSEYRHNPN